MNKLRRKWCDIIYIDLYLVKLLSYDHEIMGSSSGKWKEPLTEAQGT